MESAQTYSTDDLESTLIEYVVANYMPRNPSGPIYADTDLFEAGILDSSAVISVITHLELAYDLEIPDEDLLPENFASIRSTAEYIRLRKNGFSRKEH